VTILDCIGMTTDTNSTILGYVASRAILNTLDHNETEIQRDIIENLVFTSWNYRLDALPDFTRMVIKGEKTPTTTPIK